MGSEITPPKSIQTLAEEAVSLDRHKLIQIIQAIVDAVLVFDPQGKVLLYNAAFERIFGLSQRNIIDQAVYDLLKTIDPELLNIFEMLIEPKKPFSQEIILHQHHQKRVFLLYTIPIEDNGAISEIVAVFHEITEVKQTEKMRRDFVANVSHELRTPLSAINGYAETLLEGALDDKSVAKEFIQIIFNHSQRLSQLVHDLLDLSKLESSEAPFELQPTDLVPLIQKVIELSQKHIEEKEITLFFERPTPFSKVMAHASNIEQVMTNLLDNAIKYTQSGGTIEIRMISQKDVVQVDVEDTGIGIEAKHIPRLFERFYRVDKARSRDLGGTGLGLAIVKHIIQSHGGDVWVNSIFGKGSTFSFTLCTAETETASSN